MGSWLQTSDQPYDILDGWSLKHNFCREPCFWKSMMPSPDRRGGWWAGSSPETWVQTWTPSRRVWRTSGSITVPAPPPPSYQDCYALSDTNTCDSSKTCPCKTLSRVMRPRSQNQGACTMPTNDALNLDLGWCL